MERAHAHERAVCAALLSCGAEADGGRRVTEESEGVGEREHGMAEAITITVMRA